ncbi:MAG: hypothetical protein C0402_11075 [Thermodesulfovibrio sp.]|nr:hypothetical protein [Thermodesulfovibrio sp.]
MDPAMSPSYIGKILSLLKSRKALAVLLVLILIGAAIDYVVGARQEAIIKDREAKIKALETQAFRMVSVDVRDIEETGDIKQNWQYAVTIRIDNVADEPVYISYPEVRAFMQVGTISWMEVPIAHGRAEKKEQMYKLPSGTHPFQRILTIDPKTPYNRYLIPKYMHIKFLIRFSVLPESGFKEGEVVERKSETYIYLKPFWITEKEISAVIDFGETKVPVYMPITGFRNWNK